MFLSTQIKTTIRPNTITAQDASIYSNAELGQFWNRIFFQIILIQHLTYSENCLVVHSILRVLQNSNPCTTLCIGLDDKNLNLIPLYTPLLFADAFITLFSYPCYILTQRGIYFLLFCSF